MPRIARTAVLDVPHAVTPRGNPISAPPDWIDPAYDAAGNMTLAPRPGNESCSCEALLFVYDGWNRLAKAYEDTDGDGDLDAGTDALIAQYQYDGQNRRITKTVGETVTHFFFNESWQVLETRVGAGPDPLDQYLWDIRYIDAAVVRFHDADTNGSYEDAGDNILYYTQDANFNTTALVDEATGDVVERNIYTSYGEATFLDGNWSLTVVSGVSENGTASAYDNEILFGGYGLDAESGLYHTDAREYHCSLGRFIQVDPAGDIDGQNLYQYCGSDPNSFTDPSGMSYYFRGSMTIDTPQTPGRTLQTEIGEIGSAIADAAKAALEWMFGSATASAQIRDWFREHGSENYGDRAKGSGEMKSSDPNSNSSDTTYTPIDISRPAVEGVNEFNSVAAGGDGGIARYPEQRFIKPEGVESYDHGREDAALRAAWAGRAGAPELKKNRGQNREVANATNQNLARSAGGNAVGALIDKAPPVLDQVLNSISEARFVGWADKQQPKKCHGWYIKSRGIGSRMLFEKEAKSILKDWCLIEV